MAIVKLIFSQAPVLTSILNTTPQPISTTNTTVINVDINDSIIIDMSSFQSSGFPSFNIRKHLGGILDNVNLPSDNTFNLKLNSVPTLSIGLNAFKIQDVNAVIVITFTINVTSLTTGIADLKLNTSKLTVFPNPAIDEVNVSFTANKEKTPIEVFDIQGRLVMLEETEREIGVNKVSLNISNFSAGIYIVRAGSETFKITKI